VARDNPRHLRTRIAQLAAQLMAEHGIRDHALAKRKAARQLGIESANVLPSNEEIDEQVRSYVSLFEAPQTGDRAEDLLHQALEIMTLLDVFNPVLTGNLSPEQITPNQDIELDIYLDSSKEFERFLLNRDIPFKTEERRSGSYFTLYSDPANVVIRVMPEQIMHGRRGVTTEQLRRQLAGDKQVAGVGD
jgi:hypothetical protein